MPMKKSFEVIKRVAHSEGTVLITGKSVPEKKLLRALFTIIVRDAKNVLCLSIAVRLLTHCLKANSSDTKKDHLQVPLWTKKDY